eukprot:scaffold8599_cov110-Isochrysis_galbana.AAC.14
MDIVGPPPCANRLARSSIIRCLAASVASMLAMRSSAGSSTSAIPASQRFASSTSPAACPASLCLCRLLPRAMRSSSCAGVTNKSSSSAAAAPPAPSSPPSLRICSSMYRSMFGSTSPSSTCAVKLAPPRRLRPWPPTSHPSSAAAAVAARAWQRATACIRRWQAHEASSGVLCFVRQSGEGVGGRAHPGVSAASDVAPSSQLRLRMLAGLRLFLKEGGAAESPGSGSASASPIIVMFCC